MPDVAEAEAEAARLLLAQREGRAARLSSRLLTASHQPTVPAVVCIGDLHGQHEKCLELWAQLEERLGPEALEAATVVFLGDFVDRGPDSSKLLDWLVQLKRSRRPGATRLVLGNHDHALAAFLQVMTGEDVYPGGTAGRLTEEQELQVAHKFVEALNEAGDGDSFIEHGEFQMFALAVDPGWKVSREEFDSLVVAAGGVVQEGLNARQMVGLYRDPSIERLPRDRLPSDLSRMVMFYAAYEYGLCQKDYWDAATTVASYVVEPWWGKPAAEAAAARMQFCKAVPESHKRLLRELEWVVDLSVGFSPSRVVCLHAGLHLDWSAEQQIKLLKTERDCSPELMKKKPVKLDALRGRARTFPAYKSELLEHEKYEQYERYVDGVLSSAAEPHPDLMGKATVVVGHHGYRDIGEHEVVLDLSGGHDELALEAYLLPQRELVSTVSDNAQDLQDALLKINVLQGMGACLRSPGSSGSQLSDAPAQQDKSTRSSSKGGKEPFENINEDDERNFAAHVLLALTAFM